VSQGGIGLQASEIRMQSHRVMIEGGRIFRFSLIGICATFVYILVSILANEILRITAVPASILAQLASFVVSYFGHSVYSFRVKADHSVFLWRFALITSLTFVLATSATWLVADVGRLSPRVAIAVVAVLIPLVSYLCNRFWVFAPGLMSSSRRFEASRRNGKALGPLE
jgi:putative flippase GtrA